MSIVAHGDLVLFLNVGEEGSLVVDAEGENAVLVGNCELGAENSAVCCRLGRDEVETVEGGEHSEFELEVVIFGDFKGDEAVVIVFRNFNGEYL